MQTNIGRNIRTYRRSKNLTIEQLAKAIGSQTPYVWKLENRTPNNPSRIKLEAIAKALGITVEKLYSKNDTNINQQDDEIYLEKFRQLDEDSKLKVKKIIDIFN